MRVSGLASVDERLINNGFVMLWEEVEGWRRKGGVSSIMGIHH